MTESPQPPRRSLWPIAIISWFVVFITAILVWIVYASQQRMELVDKDYYAQEILHQLQIDAVARARAAGNVEVTYEKATQLITIQLPESERISSGEIYFYRPSDAKLDRNVKLALNATGSQQLDSRPLSAGLWKVRVTWQVDGQNHFTDKSIVIMSPRS